MQAKDLMNHPAVTCPTSSTLEDAARLMWEFDCGVIPVVDDGGQVAGIVTDRDICMAAYTQGQPLASIPVTAAMARQVVVAGERDTVERLEALMLGHQVRRIPVVDAEHRPIGIVSLNDLTRLAAHARQDAVDRELVRVLAAVGRPRLYTSLPREQRVIPRAGG